jgi:hypothetical protein
MVVKISGKGFTLENIDRYLQTELSGKVRKIQIPLMDSNAKNLFRIVLMPLHLLPALVD